MSSLVRFHKSLADAARGIKFVFTNESNFRVQLLVGGLAGFFTWALRIHRTESLVVYSLIVLVLILELLNSAVEKLLDILKPRREYQVQVTKDIMAGVVLCATVGAVLIGSIIFLPAVVELFRRL